MPARGEGLAAIATSAPQAALVEGVERIFPADVIEQTTAQFLPLPDSAYLVSHPALYWRVQDAPAAQAMAEELATITPGWSTRIYDGPEGRGVYLTYQPPA